MHQDSLKDLYVLVATLILSRSLTSEDVTNLPVGYRNLIFSKAAVDIVNLNEFRGEAVTDSFKKETLNYLFDQILISENPQENIEKTFATTCVLMVEKDKNTDLLFEIAEDRGLNFNNVAGILRQVSQGNIGDLLKEKLENFISENFNNPRTTVGSPEVNVGLGVNVRSHP